MRSIYQVPFTALGMGAAFTVLWGVADPVAAHAEVRMYTGVGKCAMGDLVSPAQAKNYAREMAMQNAREQAGVYLTNYTRTTNTRLTENEITAIANNITELVGDVSYTQIPGEVNGVPVVVYTATLQANVDTDGIQKYLERNETDRAFIVRESNTTKKEIDDNLAKIEDLNQRYNKAESEKEKENIRKDFKETDESLLALQKNNEGMARYYQKDYDGAIPLFRKAIEISPTYATPWNNLSTIYNKLGNTEKAIECSRKAIDLVPDYAPPWANLGASYNAKGNYEKAIECCRKALDIDPQYATAWNNLGFAYEASGSLDKAIECYRKAASIAPENGTYWYNLGDAYEKSGNRDEAVKCYHRTVECSPDHVKAWNNLAGVYGDLGDYDKAVEYYNKAIAIEPDNALLWSNLGYTHEEAGNYGEALECSRKACELEPNNAVRWVLLGLVYYRLEQYAEGLEVANKALELDPTNEECQIMKDVFQQKVNEG